MGASRTTCAIAGAGPGGLIWEFLNFLVDEADRFSPFRFLRNSEVTGAIG